MQKHDKAKFQREVYVVLELIVYCLNLQCFTSIVSTLSCNRTVLTQDVLFCYPLKVNRNYMIIKFAATHILEEAVIRWEVVAAEGEWVVAAPLVQITLGLGLK
jgi:hypothetical protein